MNSPNKIGYLLLNLGTPKSLELRDIKSYLNEFLNDPYVIDLPWLLRKLLVNGIILNTRPPKTREAFSKIWTSRGSPLLYISQEQRDKIALKTSAPVELAMRYSEPSIRTALTKLKFQGVSKVVVLPLYPQYALSSTETGIQKCLEEAAFVGLEVKFVEPFYSHQGFIKSFASAIQEHMKGADALLLSFHGLPERHVKKTDGAGGKYCLSTLNCCDQITELNQNCYRAQCFYTARAIAHELDLPTEKLHVSFQSRLTRKWIRPFTDEILKDLPSRGIKRLVVACPSFVTDCLETLEEIGLRARADFKSYGGEELTLVPCLNTREDWIETMLELFLSKVESEGMKADFK